MLGKIFLKFAVVTFAFKAVVVSSQDCGISGFQNSLSKIKSAFKVVNLSAQRLMFSKIENPERPILDQLSNANSAFQNISKAFDAAGLEASFFDISTGFLAFIQNAFNNLALSRTQKARTTIDYVTDKAHLIIAIGFDRAMETLGPKIGIRKAVLFDLVVNPNLAPEQSKVCAVNEVRKLVAARDAEVDSVTAYHFAKIGETASWK